MSVIHGTSSSLGAAGAAGFSLRLWLRQCWALAGKSFRETFYVTLGTWAVVLLWVLEEAYTDTDGFTRAPRHGAVLSDNIHQMVAFVGCMLVGLLLGLVQFRAFRHFDQWALLVHRPLSRTRFYLIHVMTGVAMYGVTVGLPMGIFVLWAAGNPHGTEPFHLMLTYPYAAAAGVGIPFYLAGALLMVRKARWLGTRLLPLLAAVLVVIPAAILSAEPPLGKAWLVEAVASVLIGLAAWGSVLSQGSDRRVPVAARVGLLGTLMAGMLLVGLGIDLVGTGILDKYFREREDAAWRAINGRGGNKENSYLRPAVLPDGKIVLQKVTYRYPQPGEARLVVNPILTLLSFQDQLLEGTQPARISDFEGKPPFSVTYGPAPGGAPGIKVGRVVVPETEKFEEIFESWGPGWQVVLTNRHFYIFDANVSKTIAVLPRNHPSSIYEVMVGADQTGSLIALHYRRRENAPFSTWAAWLRGDPLIENYMEVYGRDGTLLDSRGYSNFDAIFLKYVEGAVLQKSQADLEKTQGWGLGVINATGMSIYWLSPSQFTTKMLGVPFWQEHVFAGWLTVSVLSALAMMIVVRRYRLAWWKRLIWMAVAAALGPLMLVVLAGFYYWPVLVECPNCGKRRAVDRAVCSRCKAVFPRPAVNGTEIFGAADTLNMASDVPVAASMGRSD